MNNDYGNVLDLVDVKEIRDNTILLKNGGLRQILMVGGTNFSLKSEDEQNLLTQAYQNFLNALNFPLQIVIHSRKINIEKYIEHLDEYRAKEQSALLQDQITEYQEFVRSFIKDNPIMQKVFLVVIPYSAVTLPTATASGGLLSGLPFFGGGAGKTPTADANKAGEASLQESILQLKQRVTQVIQGLFTIGLDAVTLNDEQLLELLYNFYNPETIEKGATAAPGK